MKIRNVRSKDIEFDVDPEHAPTLGTKVTLAIRMGDATVERVYKVTQIEARQLQPHEGPGHAVVVVRAKGEGE